MLANFRFQFPDVERVEWINRILSILWPHLSTFVENTIRYKVEPQVREILEKYKLWGFRFNSVNFGKAPPRLEGLKVKYGDHNERRGKGTTDWTVQRTHTYFIRRSISVWLTCCYNCQD